MGLYLSDNLLRFESVITMVCVWGWRIAVISFGRIHGDFRMVLCRLGGHQRGVGGVKAFG